MTSDTGNGVIQGPHQI